MAFHRMGVVGRQAVKSVSEDRARKMAEAPTEVQVEHQMKQALKSLVTTSKMP